MISIGCDSIVVATRTMGVTMPRTESEITRVKYLREGLHYASDLTDAEWALIEPSMPKVNRIGRPRETDCQLWLQISVVIPAFLARRWSCVMKKSSILYYMYIRRCESAASETFCVRSRRYFPALRGIYRCCRAPARSDSPGAIGNRS